MDQHLPLSVSVITLNEEANLSRCLGSVRTLASEIVVVDSGSTDGTERVAREFGAKFHSQAWQGHVTQKNAALAACSQPWVLCLDADEEVSPDLSASIRELFSAGSPTADGYEMDRRTYYLGQWIHHSWSPEWRLRLARRDRARWAGLDPHDRLEVPGGRIEKVAGDLWHFSYDSVQDHFERTIRYARISAQALERSGQTCHWYHLVFSPWLALLKKLILRSSWRDGLPGWIIAYTTFFSVLAKYACLYEKRLPTTAGKSSHPNR